MSQSISPRILRELRKEKRWSLEELARRSEIYKGTIHRIEQGKQANQRGRTIDKLAGALGVEAGVLIGKTARPRLDTPPETIPRYKQLNVRVRTSALNALHLVAARYKINIMDVVGAAPLLFLLAAERSLQQRREKLQQLNAARDALMNQRSDFPQLPSVVFDEPDTETAAGWEEESIAQRDLFGQVVDEAPIHDFGNEKYEEDEHNPFVVSLKTEAAELVPDTDISWSRYIGPTYRICEKEALAIVGGDEEAVEFILGGLVPLNELPGEHRGKDADLEKRASWIKEKGKEIRSEMFPALDLGKLIEDHKAPTTTEPETTPDDGTASGDQDAAGIPPEQDQGAE